MDYEEFMDEIDHYGVKGMKWGVRKDRRLGKREHAANKRKKSARKHDSQNRRNLSDKDLDAMVKRLEQEKKLKNLVDDDVRPGKRFITGIMSEVGKRTLTTVAVGAVGYGVKVGLESKLKPAAMKKAFNPAEAAQYLAPKPKK